MMTLSLIPAGADEPAILLPLELTSVVRAYQRASKAGVTVRASQGDALLFEASRSM